MSLPGPGDYALVLAAVKATPCGQPAAGLDSGCGPASDNQRRERLPRERLKHKQDQQAAKAESLPNPGRCKDAASRYTLDNRARPLTTRHWFIASANATVGSALDCDLCSATGCPARGGRPTGSCRRGHPVLRRVPRCGGSGAAVRGGVPRPQGWHPKGSGESRPQRRRDAKDLTARGRTARSAQPSGTPTACVRSTVLAVRPGAPKVRP
jgi:hypothetical protein